MKLRPDPSLRRLGLFDLEALDREPNRVDDRATGWARRHAGRRRHRNDADRELRERGADVEETLRPAKLRRSR